MPSNPLLGVIFHWMGGLASASFYVPYKRVRGWAWEVYWLAGGVFSWLIAPWLFAAFRTAHLWRVLCDTPSSTLAWCWFWGVLWGFGGLTYGLTMRYLGMSLGMAIILGLTMVLGTLGPPLFHGTLAALASTRSGWITCFGILLAVAGVLIVARAGRAKERALMPTSSQTPPSGATQTPSAVAEFNFPRGILVGVFSGVMSSCFAFGLDAGAPIRMASLAAGTAPLSQGLPVLCVVLAGGLTTNFTWCLYLLVSNRTAKEFVGARAAKVESGVTAPSLLSNYLWCALAGTAWYCQFFFYTMGESQMGAYAFSSWTLHMASIILFGTLWGFALQEWAGSARRTKTLVWMGVAALVMATVVIGGGNYLSAIPQ